MVDKLREELSHRDDLLKLDVDKLLAMQKVVEEKGDEIGALKSAIAEKEMALDHVTQSFDNQIRELKTQRLADHDELKRYQMELSRKERKVLEQQRAFDIQLGDLVKNNDLTSALSKECERLKAEKNELIDELASLKTLHLSEKAHFKSRESEYQAKIETLENLNVELGLIKSTLQTRIEIESRKNDELDKDAQSLREDLRIATVEKNNLTESLSDLKRTLEDQSRESESNSKESQLLISSLTLKLGNAESQFTAEKTLLQQAVNDMRDELSRQSEHLNSITSTYSSELKELRTALSSKTKEVSILKQEVNQTSKLLEESRSALSIAHSKWEALINDLKHSAEAESTRYLKEKRSLLERISNLEADLAEVEARTRAVSESLETALNSQVKMRNESNQSIVTLTSTWLESLQMTLDKYELHELADVLKEITHIKTESSKYQALWQECSHLLSNVENENKNIRTSWNNCLKDRKFMEVCLANIFLEHQLTLTV
jgi:chromosome segregation ATPase